MSLSREDLVAHALNGLDAGEHARIEAELDDSSLAELETIQAHLALHDHVLEVRPSPSLWRGIEERLHEPRARSFLERFWMPVAAAAMVVAALTLAGRPEPLSIRKLFGAIEKAADGSYTSTRVSRIALGAGVVVTLDTDTTIVPLSNERLALKAGRIFLSVSTNRRGFTVETDDLEVVTTGTAFLVEKARVAVVVGTVRCRYRDEDREIAAGEEFNPLGVAGPGPTEWFRRLTLKARILAPTRVEIVISNDMPDAITKAPPTGGEPLFYAKYRDRIVPLPTYGPTISLAPGEKTAPPPSARISTHSASTCASITSTPSAGPTARRTSCCSHRSTPTRSTPPFSCTASQASMPKTSASWARATPSSSRRSVSSPKKSRHLSSARNSKRRG